VKAKTMREEWSDDELGIRLGDERQRLFNLVVQRQAQELESTADVEGAKRDVARMLTVAREREIAQVAELGPQELQAKVGELRAKLEETLQLAADRSSRVAKGRVKALKRRLGRLEAIVKENERAS